jgi:exopolysaccharide biosynthesis polyprenyl glycosylphosphotransferase
MGGADILQGRGALDVKERGGAAALHDERFARRTRRDHPSSRDARVGPVTVHERWRHAAHELGEQTRRRAAVARRSLVAADLIAAVTALFAAALIVDVTPRAASLLAAPLVIIAGKVSGLYDRDEVRLRKSTLEEVPALFQLSGISALLLWLSDGTVFTTELHRPGTVVLWAVLFAFLTVNRLIARYVAGHALPVERCLIIGDPGVTSDVADTLARRRAEVVGRLPLVESGGGLRTDFEEMVCRSGANRIVVVPGVHGDAEATLAAVTRAQEMGIYVSILPRMFDVVGSSVEFDHVDGMTLLGVHRFGISRSSWAVKRAVDIVGSGLGLLFLAPVFAIVAIAIRLDTRGSVFFRQPRMGHRGQPFEMLKFRTMYEGADRVRGELAALSHAGDGLFKVLEDPRITRVGKWLRRYSLDELPQLFNVFRGEMSLVGPRPLILEEDARIEGHHRRRLNLTPGITGPWQVLGTASRRVPLRDMVTLDYLYAGNWSLWTDVKILLRTTLHVLRGQGL